MSYPEFDKTTFSFVTYPVVDVHEKSKRYLGYKARSGDKYFNIELKSNDGITSAMTQAFYDFWKVDCKYGTSPFLIALPWMGSAHDNTLPNALVRFSEDISSSMNINWSSRHKLSIVGEVDYIDETLGIYAIRATTSTFTTDKLVIVPTTDPIILYNMSFISVIGGVNVIDNQAEVHTLE